MNRKPTLIARVIVMVIWFGQTLSIPAYGFTVFDPSNFEQNSKTAAESIVQTLKQIQQYGTQLEEYSTQLQQYQNMLQNTLEPSSYTWDQAVATMNQVRSIIDTLNYYKANLGGIDAYLNKYQDLSYYRNSPCFNQNGCTDTEWAAVKDSQRIGSEAQKKANDALFKGLDKQQDALQTDASTLEQLQTTAQSATGQLQAIGYANQLASQQANQLLQIRALLIAQQNAIVTRNQALADREAQQAAASEQLRLGKYRPSPVRSW